MRNQEKNRGIFVLLVAIFAVLVAATPSFLPTSHPPNVIATSNAGGSPDAYEPTSERVFAQPEGIQEETDLPPIDKDPPDYPNLDSNLNRLAETAAAVRRSASADGNGSGETAEPVLVTFYIEPDHVADVHRYLTDNGVFVRHVGDDYIEAHVPLGLLGAASERPGVQRVDTVIPPRPAQSRGNVISQGVGLHGAEAWHDAGYRGQGVKVGIIDTGFEGFSQRRGGELPRRVTARCYFTEARDPSSRLADCEQAPCEEIDCNHGTAVAETLVDVAPEVELYIANPITRGDLRDAADWMADRGVQVINMSLGFIVDGPGNGTSPSNVSPLKTIDASVSSGITWVNAGGNSARNVWYGTFSDPDGNGSHNFTPRDEGNTFYLPFDEDSPSGSRVTAFMRWDDSWGRADCDLNLALNRTIQGHNIEIIVDDSLQNGGDADVPFAVIRVEAKRENHEGYYWLAIRKRACADDPAWIQLTTWMVDDLEHYSPGHHIGSPAESRNPGMLAVGASHYWDTDSIAFYSSRGPTLDGRTKPDITGVACGRSTVVTPIVSSDGSITCWFAGTSQAAPHVAGLAALVQQRFPDYRPIQLTHYLRRNAAERGAGGADNIWGHGFATLPDPSSAAPAPTTVGTIDDMMLAADQPSVVDVSKYFSAADGDMLTYAAESSDDMIATATVSGSMLTIEGKTDGTATITVYALADSGTSATQTFDVMVTTELIAPTNVRVNPVGSGLVSVSWDRAPGAAGYSIIAVNIADTSEVVTKSVNNPDAVTGQIDNLTIGAEYNIYVGSFDANLDFELDLSEKRRVTVE